MTRMDPRAYLRFLVDEWPVIEAIYAQTRSGPLRQSSLRALCRGSRGANTGERLIASEIVVQLPNSTAYELDRFVEKLVGELKHRHTLGLATEMRVYLEELDFQSRNIVEGIDQLDLEKVQRHADSLDSRIRDIQAQIRNNDQAVFELVIESKIRNRHIPLRQRYAEVLEAWERYVEPVQEMIDPRGPFEALFERIEEQLRYVQRQLRRHGGDTEQWRDLDVLQLRMLQLRSQLRAHLSHASDELLPLVREIRRNSAVARGASVMLNRLRQGSCDSLALSRALPVSRRVAPTAISDRGSIEAYLSGLQQFELQPQRFYAADAAVRQTPTMPTVIEPEAVFRQVQAALPVTDLLQWLLAKLETAGLDDVLALYFAIANGALANVRRQRGERRQYEHGHCRIRAACLQLDAELPETVVTAAKHHGHRNTDASASDVDRLFF